MLVEYLIERNGSLAHWLSSGVSTRRVTAPEETFSAPVNMGEAYVQIIYPVRRHFLEEHSLSMVNRYSGGYAEATFPFEDSKVNFSTAIKTPHHIWAYLRSSLIVSENGPYPFSIATCGGIKLWVDGREELSFAPYDRNIPHRKEFMLNLGKGEHCLELYMDELAERDVFFYMDFIYHGDKPIIQAIDIDAPADDVKTAERFLMSLSLTRTVYREGRIEAEMDSSMLTGPLALEVSGIAEEKQSFTIERGMDSIVLGCVQRLLNVKAAFSVRIGSFTMTRHIMHIEAPDALTGLPHHGSIAERKAEALRFAAKHGSGLVHQAMAIMRTEGRMTDKARTCIEASLDQIERKEDCADFVLAPLLWSLTSDRRLYPEDLYHRAEAAVLSFRYWIDEKGNDAMWYFSENHAFLFHVSQYLAGALYPDRIFSVSGRTGREQMAIGRERVLGWFRDFTAYHYAEWNSATYFPVDLIGLFSLYEAAGDEDIRKAASDALDYTFRIIRDNTFHGVMSSSFGRAYEDTVKAKETNEPSFLSYVADGNGWGTLSNRATALFSLSSYLPPERNEDGSDPSSMMITACVQGLSPVWTYRAASCFHSLSSAEAFKPFRHGHQQHLMDASIGENAAPFFINHPGEKAYSGENRPSYWSGNGTIPLIIQHRSLLMMLFSTSEEEAVDYIHAYFPVWEYDEYTIDGHYLFARSGKGYLGVYFSALPRLTDWGMNSKREIIADGRKHLAVVRASDSGEVHSFEAFKELFTRMPITYDSSTDSAETVDFAYGTLSIGRDRTPMLNEEPLDWKAECGYSREKVIRKQF